MNDALEAGAYEARLVADAKMAEIRSVIGVA
jgi:hypothetical protein